MKKINLVFYLLIAVLLAGCGLSNSPKAAVKKFIEAVENNDLAAMEAVSTEETMQLVALYGWKMKGSLAENGKVKSMTEYIDDDFAVVTVIFENNETTDIELIRIDGKWKIFASMNK